MNAHADYLTHVATSQTEVTPVPKTAAYHSALNTLISPLVSLIHYSEQTHATTGDRFVTLIEEIAGGKVATLWRWDPESGFVFAGERN